MFRIADDGNCLFRGLSYAITGRHRYHANIREKIVDHMKDIDSFFFNALHQNIIELLFAHKWYGTKWCWGN